MRLPAILLALLASTGTALASLPPRGCEEMGGILSPRDGATAFKLDGFVELFDSYEHCALPSWRDHDGREVPFEVVGGEVARFRRLVPKSPLQPNRRYVVEYATPAPVCSNNVRRVEFGTSPAPAIIGVGWETFDDDEGDRRLAGVDIYFSEPLADAESANGAIEISPATNSMEVRVADGSVWASYKAQGLPLKDHPSANEPVRVRVRRGVRFASGESLAEDFDLTATPNEYLYGWRPGLAAGTCRPASSSSGCMSSSSSLAAALGLIALCRRKRVR